MSRIRSVKPELARLRALADVPPEVRWTFLMLTVFVDDEGRAEDDPRLIKADIYPLDDITAADVDAQLQALADTGELLCRYSVNGHRYLHIPWFRDDMLAKEQRTAWGQRPQKPQPSRYPACEVGHSLNGQLPIPDLFGSDPGKSGPQRPKTKDQRPKTSTGTTAPLRFAEFWSVYPRLTARPRAEQAYAKAVSRAPEEQIIAGARSYAADPNLPPAQFIPHPATWLNQDRWQDGPLPSRNGQDDPPPGAVEQWFTD